MRERRKIILHPSYTKVLLAAAIAVFLLMLASVIFTVNRASAAQSVPYKINFQGRLTDNAGNAMADGQYNIKFRIYNVSTGGSAIWEEFRETTNRVQVTNGLFSVQLGDVTALSPSTFTSQPLYFEVELPTPATATCSTASCASFTEGAMTPRQPLGASPYAMNADTLDGIDAPSFARRDENNTFTGTQLIKNTSASSFQVQNASNASILTVDTSANQLVLGQASTLSGKLIVQNATNANTVTIVSGTTSASYQLTLPTALGASGDCLKDTDGTGALGFGSCGSGGSGTLQDAYNASGTTDPQITLSGTNGGVKIRDAATPISGNLFQIQNNAGTSTMLSVNGSGYLGLGTGSPGTTLHASVNNTQTTLPIVRLEQSSTGDTTLEFKNSSSTRSFYIGQDSSASDSFVINSSAAASSGSLKAITHVQSKRGVNTGSTSTTSLNLSFTTNNTAGNMVMATFTFDTTNTTTWSCSDSLGNTYNTAVVRHDTAKVQLLGICYAMNAAAGANTVTVTFGAASPYAEMSIHEYSNVATTGALDVTASNIASGSTAADNVTTTSATTTQDSNLVVGVVRATANLSTTDYVAGTGYTARDGTATLGYQVEDKILATAGSTAATFTADVSSSYIAVMATFKAAPNTGGITDTYTNSVFKISQNGEVALQNSVNSASAFLVKNAAGGVILAVDTVVSGAQSGRLVVGSATTDASIATLQLDSYNAMGSEPTCSITGNQGGLYYNTLTNAVRGCIDGGWEDMPSTAGLGILLFGVVPDSGDNPGDLPALTTPGVSGPCNVSWASTTSVTIAPCTAYSGGRKVIIPSTTLSTSTASGASTTNIWTNICLTGTDSQPAFSAATSAEVSTLNLPAFSVNNPVLCLASIKLATNISGKVDDIFDTRTFTNSVKEYVTLSTAATTGHLVCASSTNAIPCATLSAANVFGVIVAASGTTSTTAPAAIITTTGPAYVKAIAGSAANFVQATGTAGYANTSGTTAQLYNLGISRTAFSTTCSSSSNCSGSLYVNIKGR